MFIAEIGTECWQVKSDMSICLSRKNDMALLFSLFRVSFLN